MAGQKLELSGRTDRKPAIKPDSKVNISSLNLDELKKEFLRREEDGAMGSFEKGLILFRIRAFMKNEGKGAFKTWLNENAFTSYCMATRYMRLYTSRRKDPSVLTGKSSREAFEEARITARKGHTLSGIRRGRKVTGGTIETEPAPPFPRPGNKKQPNRIPHPLSFE